MSRTFDRFILAFTAALLLAGWAVMIFGIYMLFAGPCHADSLQIGKSTRVGDFETAYTYALNEKWGIQGEYIDEGKQPDNIQNINRTINLDGIYKLSLSKGFALGAKAGVTSSRLSSNGCSIQHGDTSEHIQFRNRSGLTGYNIGVGVSYSPIKHWSAHLEALHLHYQQVDKAEFESYNFVYGGIRYNW